MAAADKVTRYAAVSCDDSPKWGYSEATTGRLIEIHSREGEEWTAFHASRGQIPTIQDLQKFKGIIISGSPKSANDNIDWIWKLKELVQNAAKVWEEAPKQRSKIIGVCFGHQLIASALGGKVERNPDKDFVAQTEEIKPAFDCEKEKLFADLFKEGPLRIVECHGECVRELPQGAQSLGTSMSCKHEIVKYKENILGIQAHPEMRCKELEEFVLPSISQQYKWNEEKLQRNKESLQLKLDADRMNNMMKTFLSE